VYKVEKIVMMETRDTACQVMNLQLYMPQAQIPIVLVTLSSTGMV
jgi:hypothetical protein